MTLGRHVQAGARTGETATAPDVTLVNLLDHVAAELAEEYVRLMEAAAKQEGEQGASGLPTESTEGGKQ